MARIRMADWWRTGRVTSSEPPNTVQPPPILAVSTAHWRAVGLYSNLTLPEMKRSSTASIPRTGWHFRQQDCFWIHREFFTAQRNSAVPVEWAPFINSCCQTLLAWPIFQFPLQNLTPLP